MGVYGNMFWRERKRNVLILLLIGFLFLSKFMIGSFYMQVIVEPGVGNQLTRFQVKESADWFDKFLKP